MVKALKFKDMFKVKHNNIRRFQNKKGYQVEETVVKKWFRERHVFAYTLMQLHHAHPMVFWLQSLDHRYVMTTSVACRLGVCSHDLCHGEDWLVYSIIAKHFRCGNDKGKEIIAEGVERGDLMYIDPPSRVKTRGACFTATDKIVNTITESLSKREIILQTKEDFNVTKK